MSATLKSTLEGHFTLRVANGPRAGTVLADFDNLITDAGLNWLFTATSGNAINECVLGSDNTAPAISDVALGAQTAATTTVQTNWATLDTYVAGPPPYRENSITFRLPSQGTNRTYSEVGIRTQATPTAVLFSRALILNGGGSPTSITILADESLDITYRVRRYPPNTDVAGTIVLDGTTHDWVLRAADIDVATTANNWRVREGLAGGQYAHSGVTSTGGAGSVSFVANRALQAITDGDSIGSGEVSALPTLTPAGYTPGSLTRAVQYEWGLSALNLGGGSFTFMFIRAGIRGGNDWSAQYQLSFSPAVPKTNTKVLRLTFTFTIGRYTP